MPCRILIGESTPRLLDESHRVEPVSTVALKGKSGPVVIYRLIEWIQA